MKRLVSRFDLLADPEPDVLITPPVYVAFDILYAESEDWRTRPLTDRREVLEGLVENAEGIFAVRRLDNDGHKAWKEVLRRGA
jgi:ATP-dependent DNA ligase